MKKLHTKMNEYLANQMVGFVKLHNLHWYVQGKGFFVLHTKFEELYDESAQIIDDLAERILAVGEKPVASLKKALEIATLPELEDKYISSEDAIVALHKDVEFWIEASKELVALAEEANDVSTADLFTGYITSYEKLLWMLKAYQA